ncbi:hypothetical protein N7447_001869 [Penicillium robsamsonii]|uniref:uncharacterized protein n=1 Tax=Penicillium robsamsonii TaxID=1792511 RepID=UPI002548ED51|nr:uncharacterized protein N7447_001869 [Penicillium robsamsonii]KAJ5835843.1 hypothetical protein N7447_001869 [Penicillium robsamsonii]
MAVGFRSNISPIIQGNSITKETWSREMEVDGDRDETVIGNKAVQNTTASRPRRRRLLLSTDSAFASTVLPSLVQNPYIELRLITDEPSALLTGTNKIPHYMDTVDSQTFDKKTSARKWLKAKTAELCEWADMLLVAPIDAGTLGAMLAGLTNTLTLALLRGWVSKKPVILIPGMTVSEWDHPLSTRQLDEISRFWPWICTVKPVLWKSNGPEDLTILPWDGLKELHQTLETSLKLPPWEATLSTRAIPHGAAVPPKTASTSTSGSASGSTPQTKHTGNADFLPLEIWLNVFEDQLRDWETAKAVGIPTHLPVPQEWQSHLPKMSTTATLEYTILRGSFAAIKNRIDALPRWKPLSDLACHLIVKFSRTDILSYLTEQHLDLLWTTSRLTNIPYRASAIYGNPNVLTWWRDAPALPNKEYMADAMDGASRAGFVEVLDWWLHSGLPLRYSERALEAASAEGRVPVLDWWKAASAIAPKSNPLSLKVGKSVLLAAQSGRTASLAWWDASGIPYSHAENVARIASTHGHVHVLEFWYKLKGPKMIFDNQVLVGPTKNGHDHILQWWKSCGLRVEFKTCDIEEALEDADPSSGAEGRVRRWWERNGLNLGVGTSEWMRSKVLPVASILHPVNGNHPTTSKPTNYSPTNSADAGTLRITTRAARFKAEVNIINPHATSLTNPSNGINGLHSIVRKKQNVAQNVRSKIQARSIMTDAIPSFAVPPLMFIGLLLGLWTWKCFWIIIMQNKLLYLSWLPPFTRSDVISDYEAECRPVQWEEKRIRSLDGTKLAVCEGYIPVPHKDAESFSKAGALQNKDHIPRRKKSVVICYFQGNGGSTPMRLPLLSHVLRPITKTSRSTSSPIPDSEVSQYTIAALSYRGYWTSSGRATQSGIEMDAQAFLNWVSETYASPETDLEIIIWGHSLGAAVACSAVSTYISHQHDGQTSNTGSNKPLAPIAGLILEAPTSSIKDMLVSLYPQKWLPYRYLWPFSWNTWDIKAKMRQMATWRDQPGSQIANPETTPSTPRSLPPILLLSAEKDEMIPPYVPVQLEQHAKSLGLEIERKDVLGAMHIEAPLKLDGRKAMTQFILNSTSTPRTKSNNPTIDTT